MGWILGRHNSGSCPEMGPRSSPETYRVVGTIITQRVVVSQSHTYQEKKWRTTELLFSGVSNHNVWH